jgi:hypothetical protein
MRFARTTALAPLLLLLSATLACSASLPNIAIAAEEKEGQEAPKQSVCSQASRNVLQLRHYQNVCPPDAKAPVQNMAIGGTGFLIQRYHGENRGLWLVTARHVVESRADLVAAAQTSSSKTGRAYLSVAGSAWSFHPGPNPDGLFPVDVAVARVTAPPDTISFRYCPDVCGANPDSDEPLESQLQEPPEVVERAPFFGFPTGDIAPDILEPFARSGVVAYTATIPHMKISGLRPADATIFHVDAPAFKGNSGGPVMREPSLLADGVRLFGLVTGANQSIRAYTLVTPVTRIKEAIDDAVAQETVLVNVWSSSPPQLECGR